MLYTLISMQSVKVLPVLLYCLLGIVVLLILISVIRAIAMGKTLPVVDNYTPRPRQDEYANNLAEMIKYPTLGVISAGGSEEVFAHYYQCLQSLYPTFFAKAQRIEVDNAYLFLLKGKGNGQPSLILAHSDVVGVNEADWHHPPFAKTVEKDKVWGRGAMDNKGMLCACLSALENLLKDGFVPNADLYMLSTKDEESSSHGAKNAAQYFSLNNITFDSVLDEGGTITCNVMPSIVNDIAAIGMCEKGYLDMRFTARSQGGHSSTPTKDNPFARLARFMHYCETKHIFKNQITPTFRRTLREAVPYMSFVYRLLLGNLWLYEPILRCILPKTSKTISAMMHTNIVFTMAQGSHAPNVLPEQAWVVGNIRNLNEEPQQQVIDKLTAIARKFDIDAQVMFNKTESTITDYDCEQYRLIKSLVEKHFPGTITTPFVMMGGTDSTLMCGLSKQIVRFLPIRLSNQQLNAMHAANENVGKAELAKAVEFMQDYILTK